MKKEIYRTQVAIYVSGQARKPLSYILHTAEVARLKSRVQFVTICKYYIIYTLKPSDTFYLPKRYVLVKDKVYGYNENISTTRHNVSI